MIFGNLCIVLFVIIVQYVSTTLNIVRVLKTILTAMQIAISGRSPTCVETISIVGLYNIYCGNASTNSKSLWGVAAFILLLVFLEWWSDTILSLVSCSLLICNIVLVAPLLPRVYNASGSGRILLQIPLPAQASLIWTSVTHSQKNCGVWNNLKRSCQQGFFIA
jgi:hypothetical protein